MANEIVYQLQATLSNGGVQDNYSTGSQSIDQSSAGMMKNVQPISNAAAGTALDLGNVGTPGMAYFINLDDPETSTETIEIGRQDGGTFRGVVTLKAGEKALFRLGSAAPFARASAGTINLMYAIYED